MNKNIIMIIMNILSHNIVKTMKSTPKYFLVMELIKLFVLCMLLVAVQKNKNLAILVGVFYLIIVFVFHRYETIKNKRLKSIIENFEIIDDEENIDQTPNENLIGDINQLLKPNVAPFENSEFSALETHSNK